MIRIAHAEAVTAMLVEVKLDRPARIEPRLNQPELPAEKKIVGRDRHEHRRRILRHVDRPHAAVDGRDEGKLHGLRTERAVHRQARAGRETHHPDARRIDAPLRGVLQDQGVGGLGILELVGEVGRGPRRRRGGRGGRTGGWRRGRRAAGGAAHAGLEIFHRARRGLQPVFQYEGGDALIRERLGDFPTLVVDREPAVAAAGRDNHGGAVGLGGIGQKGRERGRGDVAHHRLAPLAEPALLGRLVLHAAGAEHDGAGLGRGFERIDGAIGRNGGDRGGEQHGERGDGGEFHEAGGHGERGVEVFPAAKSAR